MSPAADQITITPGGVLSRERLISGMTDWIKVYSFFFDGEVYEYAYDVGTNTNTLQQAEDIALRNGLAVRSAHNFLRDVTLQQVKH